MKNKIVIVGTGYVGLVTGTCFAEMGNQVICVDIDSTKIENLKKGIIPIFEPGLEQLVLTNFKNGNLDFTTNFKDVIDQASIIFIAVGTPMGEDGSADLQYVLSVAREIGQLMQHPLIIVDKSTVPVGTADKVKNAIENELKKRDLNIPFDVVSNPEFLKEGDAINDFMKPDRVVIGANTKEIIDTMKKLYDPFLQHDNQFVSMDVRSAEMTKYAANAMLATKISFMNEIANICELVGADVNMVKNGIGSDKRIGYNFINPGCGYGGSCFPKDVQALNKIALENDYKPALIQAVERVNDNQKLVIANKVVKRFGDTLKGKIFAVWGLAFKPGTDDMREAPAIYVINELTKRGAKIKAYDPKAMEEAKNHYLIENRNILYVNNKYDTLNDSDALILLTEWKEFRSPDFEEIKKRLKNPVLFDGRNQYHNFNLDKIGFEYFQIGV